MRRLILATSAVGAAVALGACGQSIGGEGRAAPARYRPPSGATGLPPALDALSVSFLSDGRGWLLAGGCATGPACVWTTSDAGRHWRQTATAPAGIHGRAEITFADDSHGWIYGGRQTFATVDGGEHWADAGLPGPVLALRGSPAVAYAAVGGPGGAQLMTRSADRPSWSAVPQIHWPGAGTAQLAVSGPAGWLMATWPGGAYYAVSRDGSRWRAEPWPCPDRTAARLAVSRSLRVFAVCTKPPEGDEQAKRVFESADSIHFESGGAPPVTGLLDDAAAFGDADVVVAAHGHGIAIVSHSGDEGDDFTNTVQDEGPGGSWHDLQLTADDLGAAIEDGPGGGRLLMSYDGGASWRTLAGPTGAPTGT